MYFESPLSLSKEEMGRIKFDRKVFDSAVKHVFDSKGFSAEMMADPEVAALINETYSTLNDAIDCSITTETPPELTAALQNNAFIFSGFKTYHSLSEVGLELTDADGRVKPFDEFQRDVETINSKYNGSYLYAEYNHAIHTSQMAVKWHDFTKDGDRYNLQYRTAGDERVREAHAALDGTTLPPSDDFWKSYLPPNGWNCRCDVVQVLRDDYPLSDSQTAIAAGDACTEEPKARIFRYNAGQELSLFPRKHPVLPKNCGDCGNRINLIWAQDSDKCSACRNIVRQLVITSRKTQVAKMKAEGVTPIKIKGSAEISCGRLYLGSKDYQNLFSHCSNPSEVLAVVKMRSGLPQLTHVRDEEVRQKANTQKKIDRGVLRYAVYHFEQDVPINGQMVKKTFELKCEVIKVGSSVPCEHPYCIRMI